MEASAPASERQSRIRDHAVTPLELFFDLVFVLAFTQVTAKLADDLSWSGVGRAVLVLAALWWAWSAYAWLTNAFSPNDPLMRLPIFASMAALLVVALAVPQAFGENALQFALAYFVVRAMHVVLFNINSSDHPELRRAINRLTPTMLIAPAIIIVSTAFDGWTQAAIFAFALLLDIAGPYLRFDEGWVIMPHHFAERFGLIVIIALGESIVAIGAGTGIVEITPSVIFVAVTSMAVVCAMWWIYFDIVITVAGKKLAEAAPSERIRLARDSYSVMHFFLILGIIFAALGFKKTLGDYDYPLKEIPAFALCTGLAMYVATLSALRKRNVGSFNRYRLAAAAALLALYPAAREIDSKYTLISAFGILLTLILVENWRFKEVRERYRAEEAAAAAH